MESWILSIGIALCISFGRRAIRKKNNKAHMKEQDSNTKNYRLLAVNKTISKN